MPRKAILTLSFLFGVIVGISTIYPMIQLSFQEKTILSFSPFCNDRLLDNAAGFDVDEDVLAPHDPHYEFQRQSHLAPRKTLFVGVVTAKKYLDTRACGIANTWGQESKLHDVSYFLSPSDNPGNDLPIITLPNINDTIYLPQKKVYHMLKYMYDHLLDKYDFFMRSDDDVYVKIDHLLDLMSTMNPAQDIYMGSPGYGRPEDRERLQLRMDEHYCMGGPGVFFSRSALRKLGPHLHTCLKVRDCFLSVSFLCNIDNYAIV